MQVRREKRTGDAMIRRSQVFFGNGLLTFEANTRWSYSTGGLCLAIGQDVLPEKNGMSTEHCPRTNPLMTELDKDKQFYRDTKSIAFPNPDALQLPILKPLPPPPF